MANRCPAPMLSQGLSGNVPVATTLDFNDENSANTLNDSSLGYVNATGTDTGSANNYVITCPFGVPSAYQQGMTVAFIAANTNNAASLINVNGLGSVQILNIQGNFLTPGQIVAGAAVLMIFIGTAFVIVSAGGYNSPGFPQGSISPNTVGTPQVINCLGASAVNVSATLTTGGTYFFKLTNLALNVAVNIAIVTNGVSRTVNIKASDPSSVAIDSRSFYQGSTSNFNTGGMDSSQNHIIYSGASMFDSVASTSILYLQGSFN